MKYTKLFEPITIGNCWIKNRIALAPMNLQSLSDEWGGHTQRASEYYVEFAKGGVGLIISGVFKVENEIERLGGVGQYKNTYCVWPLLVAPRTGPAYRELVDRIHAYNTKIFFQLSAGSGRNSWWPGYIPVSASENPVENNPNITTRALTTEEVEKLVEAFGKAAEICYSAGVDGIEIHGHEGYLIDQFITKAWNKRTDKYGGSLENMARFPIEILYAIKDAVGKNYPVSFRIGLKHFIKGLEYDPYTQRLYYKASLTKTGFVDYGRDVDESLEIIRLLEKAGYDAFHVDAGCHESSYWAHPPGYMGHDPYSDYAELVRKIVNVPVIAVGRLGIPELAEKILQEGKADMIALGRDLLADPFWPKKVLEGRVEDIRPCLGCQEGCLGGAVKYLSCQVNPVCGREILYANLVPALKPKKVMIVGGGCAGLEAARVAAMRNHNVTIYEKSDKLGGHLIEAGVPDFKEDFRRLLKWYEVQLKKLKVNIILNTEVTPELVRNEKPDVIIIATGSSPIIPDIPGVKQSNVVTCCDLLLGKTKAGDSVVIIGGGSVGCETALWLAKQGKKVTVLEMLKEPCRDMAAANRKMLLDMLEESKVQIITNVIVQEIEKNGVIFIKNFQRHKINCETVALAIGMKPEDDLYKSLLKEFPEIYNIGDSNKPRKIENAIFEGYTIAMSI